MSSPTMEVHKLLSDLVAALQSTMVQLGTTSSGSKIAVESADPGVSCGSVLPAADQHETQPPVGVAAVQGAEDAQPVHVKASVFPGTAVQHAVNASGLPGTAAIKPPVMPQQVHVHDSVVPRTAAPKAAVPVMRSFASVVGGAEPSPVIPVSSANPSRMGDIVTVNLNVKAYEERLALCKFSLIARVVLAKGEVPWKLSELKTRLSKEWKLNNWKLISMGKGYFHILLYTEEEKNRIWATGSLNLKPGILRLREWTPDFNPETQKTTNTQIWVRFYLSWVLWHPQILSDLARCIGVPLKIDENTLSGEFGHYARVLIDLDLASQLPGYILLNRDGGSITVNLFYENIPDFCNACNSIGHATAKCRIFEAKNSIPDKGKRDLVERKLYRPKEKAVQEEVHGPPESLGGEVRMQSVPVSNRFDALKGVVSGSKSDVNQSCEEVQVQESDIPVPRNCGDRCSEEGDDGNESLIEEHPVSTVSIREGDQAIGTSEAGVSVEPVDLAIVPFEQPKRGGKSWRRGRLAKNVGQRVSQDAQGAGVSKPATRAASTSSQ